MEGKNKYAALVLSCFLLFCSCFCSAQQKEIDSLQQVLLTLKEDSNRINALNQLSTLCLNTGNYEMSISFSEAQRELAEKLGFKKSVATATNKIGSVYYMRGNYPEALKHDIAALKIREEIKDIKGIADSYNNIGLIYQTLDNIAEAEKNYAAAFRIYTEIGDKAGMARYYGNMGNLYEGQKKYAEALKCQFASLRLDKELGNKQGVAYSYVNIGFISINSKNYAEGLKNFLLALKISEEIGDKQGIVSAYLDIGSAYRCLKDYKHAEIFCIKARDLSIEIKLLDITKEAYENLSEIYSNTGKNKEALDNYKKFILTRDSLFNEENTKKAVRLEMNYAFDKKEAAAKLEQEKRDAVAAADSKKQKIVLGLVSFVLILVLGFAIFAYRSYLHKQKANIEISKQKQLIEEKQKEILDSIHYAKRIQEALLPQEKYIAKHLKN